MSIATDTAAFTRDNFWPSRLVDTCTISGVAAGAFNPTTGTYDAPTSTAHYSGPCLVRPKSPASVIVGEEMIEQRGYLVIIPFDEEDVAVDDIVTVTSTFDGVLDGKQLVVRNVRADTYNPVRKIDCEDNQGG